MQEIERFSKTYRIELLVCKSDQDHALVAKIEKVVDALRRDGFQVALEQSPVGASQSNGIAERKIQAVEDLLRTTCGIAGPTEDADSNATPHHAMAYGNCCQCDEPLCGGKRRFNSMSSMTWAQGECQDCRVRRKHILPFAEEVEVKDAIGMGHRYQLR